MLNPVRVDAAVDLAYGALIVLSIALIVTLDTNVGVAFGVGVFASYVVHVVWKMARFDPDWMTQTVEETVGETVESESATFSRKSRRRSVKRSRSKSATFSHRSRRRSARQSRTGQRRSVAGRGDGR